MYVGIVFLAGLSPWSVKVACALTWQQARAAAETRAPELQLAVRRSDVARAEVRVAGALANPTVSISSSRQTARLATGINVPLPLFGQRGLAVRGAEAELYATQVEARVTQVDLRWGATIAWVDAWEAAERARLVAVAAADAQRLLGIAEDRFQAGSSPRLDVVRATADRARSLADAKATALLVKAAASRLAVWVGADPLAPPSVMGSPGVPATLPSLEALNDALGAHPALDRDRAQQRAASARVDLEKRLRFPIVTAELLLSQFDPTTPGTDITAGAAFELPVLNQRGGSVARAESQRLLSESTMSVDAAHLRADLADAYQRTLAGAARATEIARTALPAMEEARQMTEESYRAGRTDLVRVLEAQRSVLDLRIAQLESVAIWSRSFADLERAVGRFPDQLKVVDALP